MSQPTHPTRATTGLLPNDLDWEMEIEVVPKAQTGHVRIDGIDWEFALYHDGPDIQEMLTSPGSVYHERLDQHLEVGYAFQFEIDQQDRIIARITHDATYTMYDVIIAQADLIISPRDPRTAAAIRNRIRNTAP